MKCETKVYHPNIDLEGNVCLNILREDWKPVLTINSIVYGLQYLFLDACYDDEDEDEEEAFTVGMDKLFKMLNEAPKLKTVDVNENVKSEHGKLKKRIRESEEEGNMLREFKKTVREQQFIGLVNNTDKDIKFTSKRLLMERVQVNMSRLPKILSN